MQEAGKLLLYGQSYRRRRRGDHRFQSDDRYPVMGDRLCACSSITMSRLIVNENVNLIGEESYLDSQNRAFVICESFRNNNI